MMGYFILLLATGFGVGFSPIAPGTLGTLIAIPIYLLLSAIPPLLYELTLITLFFLACWISEKAEKYYEKVDDSRIVIDEMIGFFVTMLWIPRNLFFIVAGFIFFRV